MFGLRGHLLRKRVGMIGSTRKNNMKKFGPVDEVALASLDIGLAIYQPTINCGWEEDNNAGWRLFVSTGGFSVD